MLLIDRHIYFYTSSPTSLSKSYKHISGREWSNWTLKLCKSVNAKWRCVNHVCIEFHGILFNSNILFGIFFPGKHEHGGKVWCCSLVKSLKRWLTGIVFNCWPRCIQVVFVVLLYCCFVLLLLIRKWLHLSESDTFSSFWMCTLLGTTTLLGSKKMKRTCHILSITN